MNTSTGINLIIILKLILKYLLVTIFLTELNMDRISLLLRSKLFKHLSNFSFLANKYTYNSLNNYSGNKNKRAFKIYIFV